MQNLQHSGPIETASTVDLAPLITKAPSAVTIANDPDAAPDSIEPTVAATNLLPPRPQKMSVNFSGIPAEIKPIERWVTWSWTWKPEKLKWDKPPYQTDGRPAKCNDGKTWTTFELAKAAEPRFDGIGFMLGTEIGIVGIDLDDCRNPASGEISEPAASIIRRLDTYAEVSPSGTGVKMLVRATLPEKCPKANHESGVEIYDRGRYFTITGHWVLGTPATIGERSDECRWLIESFVAKRPTATPRAVSKARSQFEGDDIETARAALAALKPHRADGYWDWLAVGMALKSISADLLVDWDEWSRQSAKFSDGECERKWRSFKGGNIGIGSLIHWAKEDGWRPARRLRRIVGSVESNCAENEIGPPRVIVGYDETQVVNEVLQPLGEYAWQFASKDKELHRTYQKAGSLVYVTREAPPPEGIKTPAGMPRIRPLPPSLLRERVSAAVRLGRNVETEAGIVFERQRPSDWLVKAIHERGEYPPCFRQLAGIVTAPTMRADGSVVQVSGYDPASRLLVELSGDWPAVPARPSRDDAIRAASQLLEVVADFPFAGDAHRSGWLSLVLSLIGRPAITGTVPLHTFDANTRGAGKSLLADGASVIATGLPFARKTWTPDDSEMRKTITAVAIESLSAVLLDNVVDRLGCGSLDAVLTGTMWFDRLLGVNKTTGSLPITTVWVATGNNVEFTDDTARRTLLIRLVSDEENPEERTGFEHPRLLDWVQDNRKRLAVAALTMLRAYVVAGRPDQKLTPWGSFETWSDLIRRTIVWTGLADPVETRTMVRESDRSATQLQIAIAAVEEAGNDVTAAEMLRLAERPITPDEADPHPAVRAAVAEFCGGEPDARRLGANLRRFKERVCGDKRLVAKPGRGHAVRWSTENVAGEFGAYGEFASNPSRVESHFSACVERERGEEREEKNMCADE